MGEHNLWEEAENYFKETEKSFESYKVLSVFAGKIYYFVRGRNAYGGAWSSQYFGNYAFHFNLDEIKQRVEGAREKGSKFCIYELPVVVVDGVDYPFDAKSLVLADICSDPPPYKTLNDRLVSRLEETEQHETIKAFSDLRTVMWEKAGPKTKMFICETGTIAALTYPQISRGSKPRGTSYHPGWRMRKDECNTIHLNKAVERMSEYIEVLPDSYYMQDKENDDQKLQD